MSFIKTERERIYIGEPIGWRAKLLILELVLFTIISLFLAYKASSNSIWILYIGIAIVAVSLLIGTLIRYWSFTSIGSRTADPGSLAFFYWYATEWIWWFMRSYTIIVIVCAFTLIVQALTLHGRYGFTGLFLFLHVLGLTMGNALAVYLRFVHIKHVIQREPRIKEEMLHSALKRAHVLIRSKSAFNIASLRYSSDLQVGWVRLHPAPGWPGVVEVLNQWIYHIILGVGILLGLYGTIFNWLYANGP